MALGKVAAALRVAVWDGPTEISAVDEGRLVSILKQLCASEENDVRSRYEVTEIARLTKDGESLGGHTHLVTLDEVEWAEPRLGSVATKHIFMVRYE